MKKVFFSLMMVLVLVSTGSQSAAAAPEAKPVFGPSDVIAAINNYRGQNGLPPLIANSTLMALAQGQSDYQASTGVITHEGPGGTRPKDRAYAAGYGDGNFIFLSEIIYGGYKADHNSAVEWWKNSPVHNTEMLRDNLSEIGAGVSTNGDRTYFTAELGHVSTWAAPADSISGSGSSEDEGDTSPPVVIAVPVVIATPQQDGSIIHIIRTGQALWTVAAVYKVDLDTLLQINGLTRNSIVKPGDEIIVRPANTPEPLPENTPFDLIIPTTTTPSTDLGVPLSAAAEPSKNKDSGDQSNRQVGDPVSSENPITPRVRASVIGVFMIIFAILVGSMFIQKPVEPPPDDEDDVVR